jgi:uncharacterized protein YeaO (DUF488 family)
VDRLWPRGLSWEKAAVDLWMKDIAPSDDLRAWFRHDPAKWPEFQARYRAELEQNPALALLREIISREETVTLLYAASDTERNNAAVLMDELERETV